MEIYGARFNGVCDRCGARLREFLAKPIYNIEQENWIPEYHELPDCIRHLKELIDAINK